MCGLPLYSIIVRFLLLVYLKGLFLEFLARSFVWVITILYRMKGFALISPALFVSASGVFFLWFRFPLGVGSFFLLFFFFFWLLLRFCVFSFFGVLIVILYVVNEQCDEFRI